MRIKMVENKIKHRGTGESLEWIGFTFFLLTSRLFQIN
ncbi:hypothetical protein MmTuc01_2925 [Methanosarcina mazei Tuc01]|uniref:Uncharacterized protein n=1 Tax=Methanosarcina mazei Tuc01 TaxID=1236903 RepID=M1PCE1_METMZ|nr:hypothetical protein MmTuc01_2925 [Methanosarcina mazei Tuc01]